MSCRWHEVEFKGRVARNKLCIDKANRIKRIEYDRKYGGKQSYLCCGLMKVDLTCLSPTAKLWSEEHLKKHDLKCIVLTVKHGGENVVVCLHQVLRVLSLLTKTDLS